MEIQDPTSQSKSKSARSTKHAFDKYEYYLKSVQSPEQDADFLAQVYWDAHQREARSMREDFCAAFALCCEWARRHDQNTAYGVDLDEDPVNYGRSHYLSVLPASVQSRVQIRIANVLDPELPKADIICALNFSYMGLKQRSQLKQYIANAYRDLESGGLLVLDCFGGKETLAPNENETEHDDFSYFWDQSTFNPVTNEALFYIHFQIKGERKRQKVFSYDWRLWSLAELRDICAEVGFEKSTVYWEGTDEDGGGNGVFTPTDKGDDCDAWIAYLVAQKP